MLKNKKSHIIILENKRCAWGKCIYCSLSKKKTFYDKNEEQLIEEFNKKFSKVPNDIEVLKIYNSGTFIDDNQIPRRVRKHIFEKIREKGIKNLVIEVWPNFVYETKLKELKEDAKDINVFLAMGLESAHNEVLEKIQKGTTVERYIQAAQKAKEYGFFVRTYVMVNLPYVKDIKKDFEETMKIVLEHSDSIAILNTFAYSGNAVLFDMWLAGEWHPITPEEFMGIVEPYKNHPKVEIYERDYVIYPHFTEEHKQKANLKGATIENLKHPYYNIWQEFISKFYKHPEIKEYAIIMHCSFRKPYSSSKSHKKIIKYLQKLGKDYGKLHQLIISNPGIVPREFENKYPFNAYDWPEWEETEEIKKAYIEVNAKRIEQYFKHHKYKHIFVYLKPGSESLKAFEIAAKKLGLSYSYVLDTTRWEEIKQYKDAYVDDLLLEHAVEQIKSYLTKI